MLILFWDVEGVVAIHFTPKSETVKSENCYDVLQTKLKHAIRSKHCGKLQNDVLWQHNSAWPHTAIWMAETVHDLGFEVIEHPS
jgi:hypothetical protein